MMWGRCVLLAVCVVQFRLIRSFNPGFFLLLAAAVLSFYESTAMIVVVLLPVVLLLPFCE
jgi:hypothetical protein